MGLPRKGQNGSDTLDPFLEVARRTSKGLSGAIVNSSRGIAFAYRKEEGSDWRGAADRAMDEMLHGLRDALS